MFGRQRVRKTAASITAVRTFLGCSMKAQVTYAVDSSEDLEDVRQHGLTLAKQLGFKGGAATSVACIFSELSRFVIEHGTTGKISMERAIDQDSQIIVEISLTIGCSGADGSRTRAVNLHSN